MNIISIIIALLSALAFISMPFIAVIYYSEKKKKELQQQYIMKHQFEQQLLLSQLETQEYSFNLVNTKLHDNIGQLLSTTKLLLGMTAMELKQPPDVLKTAEQTLSKAILDLRCLSKTMNNGWLQNFNFISYLKAELEIINTAKRAEITLFSAYENLPLPSNEQVILFSITQQILESIIQKSVPGKITIQVKAARSCIELKIAHISLIENNVLKEIMQHENIKKRIELLGGLAEYSSSGENTILMLKIPATFND